MIGQTLSHYRITAALGAGGMGEVYRATDTNLHRDVAIKVLPPDVAQDPERLERFRREAHLLASLNHPHVAAIYGLEEADGKPFLALELVEGEELKARLERGVLPLEEALEIALQIAEALEEAHGKGIVHRDLKPANVKLTPEGKVKVLDFGLAKAWGGDDGSGGASIDLSQSPTLARTGTLAGVILGTAAYMSPEQASGKAVDKRADIWSFGVVLFEMLTGQSLFSGETASEVMASVIKEEPDWDRLPAECPRAISRLLRRCLRKRPRERLQDIGDARLEIEEVRDGSEVGAEGSSIDVEALRRSERRGRVRERGAWAGALVVVAAIASLFAYRHLTEAPESRPATHFVLEAPEGRFLGGDVVPSPDGRRVVFGAGLPDGTWALWVRPLESMTSQPLAGTEGGFRPFWSPDSTALGFFAEGEIRRLNLADGTVQRLGALPEGGARGGTWSPDGTILFADGGNDAGLYTVPASGGTATALLVPRPDAAEIGYLLADFLPDGRHFLVAVRSPSSETAGVYVASLEAPGDRERVLPTPAHAVWAAGHLLYSTADGTLVAQPFDHHRRRPTGEPAPVASTLEMRRWPTDVADGHFSASPGGVLAYREVTPQRQTRLTWLDRGGKPLGTLGEPADYEQMALSPDGRHVAAEVVDPRGGIDLWTFDAARGVASRVTTGPADERDPVWLPGSQELMFSDGEAGGRLLRKGLGTGTSASPVLEGAERYIPESLTPDGRMLLASSPHFQGLDEFTVWAIPLDGEEAPEALLQSEFLLDEFQVSPDGRWLSYISEESGDMEVYIEPFRRPGERVRVSVAGGGQPRWRADGRELYYGAPGAMMAVTVEDAESRVEIGTPRQLFEAPPMRPGYDDYAVTSDGQRFLVKVPIGEDPEPRFHVVVNWPSLLE